MTTTNPNSFRKGWKRHLFPTGFVTSKEPVNRSWPCCPIWGLVVCVPSMLWNNLISRGIWPINPAVLSAVWNGLYDRGVWEFEASQGPSLSAGIKRRSLSRPYGSPGTQCHRLPLLTLGVVLVHLYVKPCQGFSNYKNWWVCCSKGWWCYRHKFCWSNILSELHKMSNGKSPKI